MGKGQISIYVIIGILVCVMFFLYYNNAETESATGISQINMKKESLKTYLDLCVKDTVKTVIFDEISANGGYSNHSIENEHVEVYNIGSKRIAFWNDGLTDISPGTADFQAEIIKSISGFNDSCTSGVQRAFPDVIIEPIIFSPEEIIVNLNDDNIDAIILPQILVRYRGDSANIERLSARLDYNLKRDIELAKKILMDAIDSQPSYFDITMNCMNYSTNGKTNIYSIDVPDQDGNDVTIISVIDYEPFYRDHFKSLRINFALRNVNVMGFCAS